MIRYIEKEMCPFQEIRETSLKNTYTVTHLSVEEENKSKNILVQSTKDKIRRKLISRSRIAKYQDLYFQKENLESHCLALLSVADFFFVLECTIC